jgi:hypothetical protein
MNVRAITSWRPTRVFSSPPDYSKTGLSKDTPLTLHPAEAPSQVKTQEKAAETVPSGAYTLPVTTALEASRALFSSNQLAHAVEQLCGIAYALPASDLEQGSINRAADAQSRN